VERPSEGLVCARADCRKAHQPLALEAEAEAFADQKGWDAFAFDPIESRYLEAGHNFIQIRTPYSRTVLNEIREIPFARWEAERRLWIVPYRSFDELRRRWPAIGGAAERNEPEMRKARREALKGTEEEEASKARTRERRRKHILSRQITGPHSSVPLVHTPGWYFLLARTGNWRTQRPSVRFTCP
jgi:hypothetical protein